jgi:hypothetical protein
MTKSVRRRSSLHVPSSSQPASSRSLSQLLALDLMGESFKRQLQMDGGYDRVSFITTRSDDLSPREVIRSIPSLKAELEDLETELDTLFLYACSKGCAHWKERLS